MAAHILSCLCFGTVYILLTPSSLRSQIVRSQVCAFLLAILLLRWKGLECIWAGPHYVFDICLHTRYLSYVIYYYTAY